MLMHSCCTSLFLNRPGALLFVSCAMIPPDSCTWTVVSGCSGCNAQLQLRSLPSRLATSSDLAVYDGVNTTAQLLRVFTSVSNPLDTLITGTSTILFVVYTTRSATSTADAGFSMSVSCTELLFRSHDTGPTVHPLLRLCFCD